MLIILIRFPEFKCLFANDSVHHRIFEVVLTVTGAIGDKTLLKRSYLFEFFAALGTHIQMRFDRLVLAGIKHLFDVAD